MDQTTVSIINGIKNPFARLLFYILILSLFSVCLAFMAQYRGQISSKDETIKYLTKACEKKDSIIYHCFESNNGDKETQLIEADKRSRRQDSILDALKNKK